LQHPAVQETASMLFFSWYPILMLAVESSSVVDMRLRKIASGRVNPADETRLMISEKIDAAIEAGSMLFAGSDARDVIAFYRRQVAANATRLS
jgi:hypothetical protein